MRNASGFEFNTDGFYRDPYDHYRRFRESNPFFFDRGSGRWFAFRHRDVQSLLQDGRFSSDSVTARLASAPFFVRSLIRSFSRTLENTLFLIDAPQHTRLRGLVREFFLPKNMKVFAETAERLSSEALKDLSANTAFDLKDRYAYAFPVGVICRLLGLPLENAEELKRHSRIITYCVAGGKPGLFDFHAADRSVRRLETIFQRAFDGRIRVAEDGVIRHLIDRTRAGELAMSEYLAMSLVLLIAGHETTTNQICNGIHALMRNREQWELLRGNPDLLEAAVEEIFRFDSSVQGVARVATRDLVHDGHELRQGDVVYLLIGSANRDPEACPDPERFDLTRAKSPHLAFGFGAHHCLGSFLAKMELKIALRHLIERFPRLELADEEIRWQRTLGHRGPLSLPVWL